MTDYRIHIGGHRTASTLIQTLLERLAPTLDRQGVAYSKASKAVGQFMMEHSPIAEDVFEDYAELAGGAYRGRDYAILSDEGFSGDARRRWQNVGAVAKDLLRVLESVGPVGSVHVVLCTRRQDTWLESMYQLDTLNGGARTFEAWLQRFGTEGFDWQVIIDAYERVYGEGSMTVVPYEVAERQGTVAYVRRVMAGLCVDFDVDEGELPRVNCGLSPVGLELARRTLRILNGRDHLDMRRFLQARFARAPGAPVRFFSDEQRARIAEHYGYEL